jgi:hypothetical protein
MKRSVMTSALALAATLVLAHDEHEGKPITITGQVVDTGCYLVHDSKGAAHATCAAACAKAGVPWRYSTMPGRSICRSRQTTRTRISS